MDAIASTEEQIVTARLRQKLNEVNAAAQVELASVEDHINFNLQQAYFKCAYECFDRRKKQGEINNCVEHCSVPVLQAQNLVEGEMAKFQDRLNRALMVCQDTFESAKLLRNRGDPLKDLESCVDRSVQDSINTLPPLVARLKMALRVDG